MTSEKFPTNLNDELAADLPAQRDDEPSSLRQDILDELADHLMCAVQREQFASASHADETTIWQRVLSRFGDPVQLARQLWFEAMKEKLMTQKLLTAIVVLLVVGMGYMLYAMNSVLSDSRDYQAMLATQLNESQQRQEDLMTRLLTATESRSDANSSKQPSEWNNLSVKVVYDDEEQTPVVGAKVSFQGRNDQAKSIPPGEEMTNSNGIADLGMVIYGQYWISVVAPNGVQVESFETSVRPGADRLFEIEMPNSPTVPIKFEIAATDQLSEGLSIDASRIWYLVTATKSGGTSNFPKWQSTDKRYQYTSFLLSSEGIAKTNPLANNQNRNFEFVNPEERFDGLVSEEDKKIHRHSQDRILIKMPMNFSDSFEMPFGHHQYIQIQTYVEMDLSDGRKILTAVSDPTIPDVFDFKTTKDEESQDSANSDFGLVGGQGGGGYGYAGGHTSRMLSQFLPKTGRPEFHTPSVSVDPELVDRLANKPINLQPNFGHLQMINLMTSLPIEGELVFLKASKKNSVPRDPVGLFQEEFEGELAVGDTVDVLRGDSDAKIVEDISIYAIISQGWPSAQYLVSLSDEQIEAIQKFSDQKLGVMPMLELVKVGENSGPEEVE